MPSLNVTCRPQTLEFQFLSLDQQWELQIAGKLIQIYLKFQVFMPLPFVQFEGQFDVLSWYLSHLLLFPFLTQLEVVLVELHVRTELGRELKVGPLHTRDSTSGSSLKPFQYWKWLLPELCILWHLETTSKCGQSGHVGGSKSGGSANMLESSLLAHQMSC